MTQLDHGTRTERIPHRSWRDLPASPPVTDEIATASQTVAIADADLHSPWVEFYSMDVGEGDEEGTGARSALVMLEVGQALRQFRLFSMKTFSVFLLQDRISRK